MNDMTVTLSDGTVVHVELTDSQADSVLEFVETLGVPVNFKA